MRIGTRSVLFGAHAFWLHPFFVFAGWWTLYGFPWDPRLWVAFFVHDLGYIGKPDMDGDEGERHVEWGAWLMGALYLPMVRATGEIHEYMKAAKSDDPGFAHVSDDRSKQREWWANCQDYTGRWVAEHVDGRPDEWTKVDREPNDDSGVFM